uniref:Uncharacterized protein n=1 Tax=Ditylenchus dipsaci TaxID=166011 RepID=A0A915CQD4_9BILA
MDQLHTLCQHSTATFHNSIPGFCTNHMHGHLPTQLLECGLQYWVHIPEWHQSPRPGFTASNAQPLSWELAGIHCVVLLGLSLFFLVVLLGLEYRSRLKFLRTSERLKTQRLLKSENSQKHRLIDPDVLKEQDAVERLDELDDYGLVVKNVSKAYGSTHLAVNNLSFAVGKGQCLDCWA